jgi:hypothetical protein
LLGLQQAAWSVKAIGLGLAMQKTIVKIYDYRALIRLILHDMETQTGIPQATGRFMALGGLDLEQGCVHTY